MKVTGDEVKAAMIASGTRIVPHHECGFCGYMTAYVRASNDDLYFDPGCDCTGSYRLLPDTWDDAARWINMQSDEAIRAELKRLFGFKMQGESA